MNLPPRILQNPVQTKSFGQSDIGVRNSLGILGLDSEFAVYPVINAKTCTGCKNCVDICPGEVYELAGDKSSPARPQDCIECWACVNQCPTESIHLDED